jgi:tetratricopeptide (TPR) repeat protein
LSDYATLLAQAWQHYQANQFYEAEQTCVQLLQADPGQVEALHLLASVAQRTGQPGKALDYLHQAIAWQPAHAPSHFQLALLHEATGSLLEAVHCYREAVRLQPDFAQARNNLGAVLQRYGQFEEAEFHLQQAIQLRPDYAKAYLNLGTAHAAQGRVDDAIACYQWVLQLEPDSAEACCNLGVAQESQGKLDEAAASYKAALRVQPNLVEALFNLGNVYKEQDRLEEAIACYRDALTLRPGQAEAHNNLGVVLNKQGRHAEAINHYQAALALRPDFADALTNLGAAWTAEGFLEDALRCHTRALQLQPRHAGAHSNLGLVFHRKGQLEEALREYEEAIRLAPDCADAHWNRSLIWLVQGNFALGWPAYEWRWRSQCKPIPFTQPRWDGADLAGRTILLHAEQGLGDTLQFIRYAPLVKQRGGTVIVQCHGVLRRVLSGCPGIDVPVSRGEPLPPFDVQVPLLSLPALFGTSLETVPAEIPYLRAEPELTAYWRQQLASQPGFNVGIVWQGNPGFAGDRGRSMSLSQFAPLAKVPGVWLYSLQVGEGSKQLATAELPVTDLGSRFDPASLADLAGVLVNLDLLVSVDTAPVHLAGALGVPVWVALPVVADWRWLLDRTESPWYPTMRLFRQRQASNWSSVFEEMAIELQSMLGAGPRITRMKRIS